MARYVIPKVNNELGPMHESSLYVRENRDVWSRATKAVVAKILENPAAHDALNKQQAATRKAQTAVRLAAHSAVDEASPTSKGKTAATKKTATKNAARTKATRKKSVGNKTASKKNAGKNMATRKALKRKPSAKKAGVRKTTTAPKTTRM